MLLAASATVDIHHQADGQRLFGALIVDLLTASLSLPDDLLGARIVDVLGQVIGSLDLDQGMLIHWEQGPTGVSARHTWTAPEGASFMFPLEPSSARWVYQRLLAGNAVLLSSVDDLPTEAEQDRAAFRSVGPGSLACLPLRLGSHVVGIVAFARKGQAVPWPDELVWKLQLVVALFGNILSRHQCQQDMEGQLQHERLLTEVAARLATVPATEMDAAIEDTQRLICQRMGLCRSALWQASDEEPDVLLLTHLHQPEDGPHWQKRPASGPLCSSYWVLTGATPPAYLRLDVKALFPWVHQQLQRGQAIILRSVEDLPEEAAADRERFHQFQTRSIVIVPLHSGGGMTGCLAFACTREERAWSDEQVRCFQFVADVFANALARRRADQALRENNERLNHTVEELQRLQEQLRQENLYLTEEVQARRDKTPIVGNSDRLLKVIRQAERVATTDSTVLILGETGTGKELLAQYIHRISGRSGKAFIALNIAAIPATLLESELFGREKGAYTGALTREMGRFQMADGGTLLLDEIGEMPLETQTKLLRVLQTGEFERLGSGQTLHVDVRVIAATNRDLSQLLVAGSFRQDLLYRLNVFPIILPPLRDRLDDIPLLVWTFVRELSQKMGRAFERIRKKDLDALQSYGWPGNVRELRNVVERSMILSEGPELRLVLPDGRPDAQHTASRLLVDVEAQHILKVLEAAQGRIRGPGGAAEILGIKPTTLYSLMGRLGIERGNPHSAPRRSAVGASAGRCADAGEE
jgi:formate hydrogenlyase transcriptional activator